MSDLVAGMRVNRTDWPASPTKAIVLFPERPDDPLVQRGYCYCGAPLAIAQHQDCWRWTVHHGEVAVVSFDEYMLLLAHSPIERAIQGLVRQRLLHQVLETVHTWDHKGCPIQVGPLQ